MKTLDFLSKAKYYVIVMINTLLHFPSEINNTINFPN